MKIKEDETVDTERIEELKAEIAHLEQCPKTEKNKQALEIAYDTLYCVVNDC